MATPTNQPLQGWMLDAPSMASVEAIVAFEEATWGRGVRLEWKPRNTMVSFANGQKEVLELCVIIHLSLIHI
eukprot:12715627-Prorocentrum_lima.AAC.1